MRNIHKECEICDLKQIDKISSLLQLDTKEEGILKHKFDLNTLMDKLHKIKSDNLAVDDSRKLFDDISEAHTLLYLGDNCGEIVLDKIFIEELKAHYNNLKVYYGARGQAIVNDVTIDDASDVNMSESAEVISNGDISLGTVIEKTSSEFQKVFNDADVVICKGQGNYEGLINCSRDNVYFLFMAKCNIVADPLGIDTMSIVALKKSRGNV